MTGVAVPIVVWLFSAGPGPAVSTGDAGQWEHGVPTSGPNGTDAVWATVISGPYLNDATDLLELPLPDLSGAAEPVLVMHHWYDIQAGDIGAVEVHEAGQWSPLAPVFQGTGWAGFSGSSSGWTTDSFDLSSTPSADAIRLVFSTDGSVVSDGWYVAEVGVYDGDVTPPAVTPLVTPVDTELVDQPYDVVVEVLDDKTVQSVVLTYQVNGGTAATLDLFETGPQTWTAAIPPQPSGSDVTWSVLADDGVQQTRYPENTDAGFRVALRPPTDVRVVDSGRVLGTEVEIDWTPPESVYATTGYRLEPVSTSGQGPFEVADPPFVLPLEGEGPVELVVYTRFAEGLSDPSVPLLVQGHVASLTEVVPDQAAPGTRLYLEVRGEALYLVDGATTVAMGAGVVVEEVQTLDVNEMTVLVEVDEGALPGPRDVVITTPHGVLTFPEAFVVGTVGDLPQIVSVEPDVGRQGEEIGLTLTASEDFAGQQVGLELPVGLVQVSEPVVDGPQVQFEVFVTLEAAPGPSTLVVDDGVHLWTAEWTVEERRYVGQTGCQGCTSSPSGARWPWWLALMALAAGRRRIERSEANRDYAR